jgi:hypothetical protein
MCERAWFKNVKWGHLAELEECFEDSIKKEMNVEIIDSGRGPVAAR